MTRIFCIISFRSGLFFDLVSGKTFFKWFVVNCKSAIALLHQKVAKSKRFRVNYYFKCTESWPKRVLLCFIKICINISIIFSFRFINCCLWLAIQNQLIQFCGRCFVQWFRFRGFIGMAKTSLRCRSINNIKLKTYKFNSKRKKKFEKETSVALWSDSFCALKGACSFNGSSQWNASIQTTLECYWLSLQSVLEESVNRSVRDWFVHLKDLFKTPVDSGCCALSWYYITSGRSFLLWRVHCRIEG